MQITREEVAAHQADTFLPPDAEFALDYARDVKYGRHCAADATVALVAICRNAMPFLPQTLRLIREGDALLVAEVADVLALLDLDAVGDRPTSMAASDRDGLARRERTVLDAVPARGSIDVQALVRASGLATVDVLAATGRLVSTGMLDEAPGGWRLPRA